MPAGASNPDPFAELFGAERGRPRPVSRRRVGARRPLSAIASDALRQPQDPATVHALVAELRELDRWQVVPTREQPLLRLTLASLVAGAQRAFDARPSARSKTGKAEMLTRRLALAAARVLLADLVDERAGDWQRIRASRGRQQGALRGDALARWRRVLAEDRELLANPDQQMPPSA